VSPSSPYRPAPPQPTRLNHVALLAFALLIVAGAVVTLLTVHAPPSAVVDAPPVAPRAVSPQLPSFPAPAPAVAQDSAIGFSPRVASAPVVPTPAAVSHVPAFRSPLLIRPSRDSAVSDLDTTSVTADVHAASRYVLESGTVIPALLVTEIRSTLPGLVVAQVERDVYDTPSERHVLVPRGARLVGRYDTQVSQGEDALLVVWMRLAFPDGRWVALPGFESADAMGTAGLRGSVNTHLPQAYLDAGLMSLVGAGAQLSQAPASVPYGVASPGQVVAGSLGQQVTEESLERLRADARIPPTITVRGGTSFLVVVSRDVVFDRPY